jgi:hypothetical protein
MSGLSGFTGGLFHGSIQILLGFLDVIEGRCDRAQVERWSTLALNCVTKFKPSMAVVQ